MWSEQDDAIIGGDLTAALGYITPAGGVVLTPVAPIGLRDRGAGTVSFTTSLGFGRELDRIKENPKVALAFHAREHGFATEERFVLVQGTATYDSSPDAAFLEETVLPASVRFMGEPKTGPFWDRWLSAYYADRVLVEVAVERVASWPSLDRTGEPVISDSTHPGLPALPADQAAPKNGVAPRVDAAREAEKARRLPHVLIGYVDADGYPMIAPVNVGAASPAGFAVEGPLPPGSRRAGLLAHSYRAKLIGIATRQHTGWLSDGVYAPHTAGGFQAPANKTLLLLANGFMARRGLAKARAAHRS